ncbi:MAG TPA: cytochrome P450 [Stellaceae bacterium]|nr:cytochrome P450 [Stellaceae bacterium]
MAEAEPGPVPAMPQRPPRPLSTLRLLRVALANSLAACDEELFDTPLVERRYVWGRFFSVSDPDGIRRVMLDNLENYPRIGPIRRVFGFGSGTGMLAAEGELWRRHRRILNPTLDHRAVLADLPMIATLAEELADSLARIPAGQELDIGETFAHLITAATGRLFAADAREIDPVVYRLGQYPGKYRLFDFIAPPWALGAARRSGATTARAFAPLIDRLVAARRRPRYDGARDLLWRVAHAGDPQGSGGLDADELRDEILTLGATAATSIRVFPWLWYLLALHPQVEARLHAELATVLGGRAPTAEDLPRLVYLRRIIDETLRLYPPAPTMLRTAAADDVICGRKVPRGSIIGVLPWVVHRHRALWRDPDRFDPDRFAPEAVAARSRYAYLPFAIGPRVCIGASLAIVEIVATTAIVAQRFRFRPAPGRGIEPTAWTNLHPRGGMWMRVEPRS